MKNANVIDLDTATYNDYIVLEDDDEEINHTEKYQVTWEEYFEDEVYEKEWIFSYIQRWSLGSI